MEWNPLNILSRLCRRHFLPSMARWRWHLPSVKQVTRDFWLGKGEIRRKSDYIHVVKDALILPHLLDGRMARRPTQNRSCQTKTKIKFKGNRFLAEIRIAKSESYQRSACRLKSFFSHTLQCTHVKLFISHPHLNSMRGDQTTVK